MYIISSFEYSTSLEMMLYELNKKGISKEDILAFPLDRRAEEAKLFDSIHRSDGKSLLDIAAFLGSIFMILGSIYGYLFKWGPILWALIGLIFGALLGFLIDILNVKNKQRNKRKQATENRTEVVVIINCQNHNMGLVEEILWDHFALGVCKVENNPVVSSL